MRAQQQQQAEGGEGGEAGQAGEPPDFGGDFQHIRAPVRHAARFRMAFEPAHMLGMIGGELHQLLDIHEIGIMEPRPLHAALDGAEQIDGGEGQHLRARRLHHMGHEAAESPGAGAALIDDGGDPGVHARVIGPDAEVRHIFVDMHMQVDQARRHDGPLRRDLRLRLMAAQIRRHGGDAAVPDGDVEDPIETLGRVHHPPALNDQIVLRRCWF